MPEIHIDFSKFVPFDVPLQHRPQLHRDATIRDHHDFSMSSSYACRQMRPNSLKTVSALVCCMMLATLSTGCGPSYSPDTYASNAAQQAAKVDQGIVVGVRAVMISADTALETTTAGAAGGIAGSEIGAGAGSALGALGGTVAGGVVGAAVGHAAGDTDGYEYIVRKPNGELLSVTQKDPEPLAIGAPVLIIEGPQARIVIDYTVHLPPPPAASPPAVAPPAAKTAPAEPQQVQPQPVQAPPVQAPPVQTPPVQTEAGTAPVSVTPLPPPTSPATSVAPAPAGSSGEKKPADPSVTAKPGETPAAAAPGGS
jgi:outer membrane lipoprotein SlyB